MVWTALANKTLFRTSSSITDKWSLLQCTRVACPSSRTSGLAQNSWKGESTIQVGNVFFIEQEVVLRLFVWLTKPRRYLKMVFWAEVQTDCLSVS